MTPEQTEARREALHRAGMVAFVVIGFVVCALMLRAEWPDAIMHRPYIDPDPIPRP